MEDKKPEVICLRTDESGGKISRAVAANISDIAIKDDSLARLMKYHDLVAGSANSTKPFTVNAESYNPVRNTIEKWIEGIERGPGVKPLDPNDWFLRYSDEAIRMIDERRKKTNKYVVDYIVEVWYKYDFEHEYTKSYELISYSFDDTVEWENDWFEGQQDIIYKRVVELDAILDYYFDHVKEEEEDNHDN
jgi:hypothetical protein